MAYTQFDDDLRRRLGGIFPQSQNVVDVSDTARRLPTADVSGIPKRLSGADAFTLISAINDPQGQNRANALRQLVGRGGTYKRSSTSGFQAALSDLTGTTDEEIQAAVLLKLRQSINSGDLPLGNMAAFNQWAVTLPHHFIKDVRSAYQSMSDQVSQEGTSRRAEELQAGKVTRQDQEIAAAEHASALEAGEIESQQLGLKLDRQKVEAGTHPDTKTIVLNGVPYLHEWDQTSQTYIPLKDSEGKKLQAAQTTTGKMREFYAWLKLTNEGRVAEGKKPLSASEVAQAYDDRVLAEVRISRPYKNEEQELRDSGIAFVTGITQIHRMLEQLADPKVVIGGVGGFIKGWESIVAQGRQLAGLARDTPLLGSELYDFGAAAKAGQLHGNITNLAYQLARAAEPGGRLNENDVQRQINRITGSLQSKRSMAGALKEVHNQLIAEQKIRYNFHKRDNIPGTELEWEDYKKEFSINEMRAVEQDGIVYMGWDLPDGEFHFVASWESRSR